MASISAQSTDLALNDEEIEWLADHPVIKVSNEMDWTPFNFNRNDIPQGFSIDYMTLLAETIGFEIDFISGPSWNDFMDMIKNKELDVILNIAYSDVRAEYIEFTNPYFEFAPGLYTRNDYPLITSVNDLYGKKFAVPKGFFFEEYFKDHPQVELVRVLDTKEALLAVSNGSADAMLDLMPVVNFLLNQIHVTNLHANGTLGVGEGEPIAAHLGIRDDWQIFRSILNKGMNNLPEKKLSAIRRKWLGYEEELNTVLLTDEENKFFRDHPVIRVHNEENWPPYNYYENGSPQGFSIDYMNLLADLLDIEIEYVSGPSWNEFLTMIKHKELDVMLNIVRTEERSKYLLYTEPYARNPNVIVSSKSKPYNSIEELYGKTVAIPSGFFYEEVLEQNYPQIKRLPVLDVLDSLKAVSLGKADAAFGEEAVVYSIIARNMLTNLKVSGEAKLGDSDLENLNIGVRDDFPLLLSSLKKAMAAVTPQQIKEIQKKWLFIDSDILSTDSNRPSEITKEDNKIFANRRILLILIAVLLILSIGFWTTLKITEKKNIILNFGSSQIRWITLIGLSIFISIVIILGIILLDRNKSELIANTEVNLKISLENAENRLDVWINQKIRDVERLGHDPELSILVKQLLAVYYQKEDLVLSSELNDIRDFFEKKSDEFPNIGFFVIDPQYTSIGSKRDTNIGTRNFIAEQFPELLKQAFQGSVVFVPPIKSDVKLQEVTGGDGEKNPDTMFFLGPVYNNQDKIIAVFTLRIDPSDEFSEALQFSSVRATSDVYAINGSGLLLSKSRFEENLRDIGLLLSGQVSAMNIEIRDPGVNLLRDKKARLDNSDGPLTVLAGSVLEINNVLITPVQEGSNSIVKIEKNEYRDYRGVPVYGAGLWSQDLGLGIIAEIDVSEALRIFYSLRITVFIVLGVTVLLSVGAILLVLILGDRTNKALIRARDDLEEIVSARTEELSIEIEEKEKKEVSLRKLTVAIDEGPVIVIITDNNGIIEYVNPKFEEVTGYKSIEVIGQNPRIIKSDFHDSDFFKEMWAILITGKDWSGEVLNKTKSGNLVWNSVHIASINNNDNEITHYISIQEDINEQKKTADALDENRQLLSSIIDNSTNLIYMKDINGKYLLINKSFKNALNIKEDDIIGKTDLDFLPKDIVVKLLENDQKVINTKQAINEEEIIQVNGQSRDMLSIKFPIMDAKGEVTAVCGMSTDISELKQVEEELKGALEQVNILYETSLSLGTTFDLQALLEIILTKLGQVIPFDSASVQELKGDYFEIIHTQGIPDADDVIGFQFPLYEGSYTKKIFVEKKPSFVSDVREFEEFTDMSEGTQIRSWMGIPLIYNNEVIGKLTLDKYEVGFYDEENAKFGGAFATQAAVAIKNVRLFEELKQTADDLEEKKAKLDAIFSSLPDLTMILDEDGIYIEVIQEADSIKISGSLSYIEEASDLVGKNIKDLLPPDVADQILHTIRRTLETGLTQQIDLELESTKGIRSFNEKFTPLGRSISGKPEVVVVARDNTDIKLLNKELAKAKDEAEAATEAKSNFLATMSHEIRTPMNAVIGLNHLQLKTELNRKQEDYALKIGNSAQNLLGIINDILDFSKIEAGKMNMEFIPFKLIDVMDNLSNVISVKIQNSDIELIFDIHTDVPSRLIGDPLRLGQVLLNLCNNAVKFTEKGSIIVRVTLENIVDEEAEIKFSVTDTGIGLTDEQKKKLFKPFSQADMSTTRKYGGTGLGLSISKQLVSMMHGGIDVISESGEGSNFFFTIKGKVLEEEEVKQLAIPTDVADLKVLIVDDNEVAREVLEYYISDFKLKVETASNGQEAVEIIKNAGNNASRSFDLILMDFKMPGLNGVETFKEIQDLKLEKNPKAILVTSYGREEILNEAVNAGFDSYLIKPVNQSLLFDSILQVFGHEEILASTIRQKNKSSINLNSFKGNRILLAEDNEVNQQVAVELLESEGLIVEVAENGQIAYEMVQKNHYDLVLMDLNMPVMDGITATKNIREDLKLENLPIVAMTADAMSGVDHRVREAGMNDYVSKPINVKSFFQTLHKWLTPNESNQLQENIDRVNRPESIIIPGLNIDEGLERVGGQWSSYLKILKKFRGNQDSFADDLKIFLDDSKFEDAIRMAHTLKGVTGNLGAMELFELSHALELKLKDENPDLDEIRLQVDEISRSLNQLFRDIDSLNQEENVLDAKSVEDSKDILNKITELESYLQNYDYEANTVFTSLKSSISNTSNLLLLDNLGNKIESYNFDKASEILEKLKSQYVDV
jgi:two-component system, sensor histidine kinase and response regulator